jgi:hypothetical protein
MKTCGGVEMQFHAFRRWAPYGTSSSVSHSVLCNIWESVLGNDWIEELTILKYSTHFIVATIKLNYSNIFRLEVCRHLQDVSTNYIGLMRGGIA